MTASRDTLAKNESTTEDGFRGLVENLTLGVVIHSNDQPVYANQAFADILGYADPDEVLAMVSVDAFVAPSERERMLSYRQRRYRGDPAPETYEYQALRRDGRIIWLEIRVNVTAWHGVPAIQMTCLDVTDRHESMLSLRQSEARYKQFAETGSDWLWETDDQHRFTYFSPYADDIDPNPRSRNLGTTRFDRRLSNDKDDEKWRAHRADLDARLPFKNFEFSIEVPDGSVRVIRVNGQPVFASDGKFVGYRGTASNITEQRRVEDLLAGQMNRLQAVVDAIPAIISVKDRDLRFLMINRMQAEELGCTAEQAIGKRRDAFPRRGLSPHEDRRYTAVQTTQEREVLRSNEAHLLYEESFTLVNGKTEHRLVNKIPLRDTDEQMSAILTVAIDITKLKHVEEVLRHTRDQAEAANQAKSAFLSSMSHELRTPLNAVLGFGQLLTADKKNPLNVTQRQAVDHILAGARHLLSLISDVLELSRIESGTLEISLEHLDLHDVLNETLDLVGALDETYGVTINLERDEETRPQILADRRRLCQVLLNLITNAIKYNKPGGAVTVACRKVANAMLRVEVSDTGPGIREADQPRLFEPFDRLGNETSDIEGTGIGLTIAKQLVEAMGGAIDFNSVEGVGSTFWVDLPIATPESPKTGLLGGRDAGDGANAVGESFEPRELKVLYVEDNAANMAVMAAFLNRLPNVLLIQAETAERGIELAKALLPDIVLMDLGLPGMSGFEALEILRAIEPARAIPVVAITADATEKAAERCRIAGFEALATKPLDLEQINAILTKFADKYQRI